MNEDYLHIMPSSQGSAHPVGLTDSTSGFMVEAQPRGLPCFSLKFALRGQLLHLKGQFAAAKTTKETVLYKKVIA